MRIVELRESTFGIQSEIRNSVIDFSEMTVSLVALVSDRVVDGKPITGFGFNSNGRYGQRGLLEDRFFPRLRHADPEQLIDDAGRLDPEALVDVAMRNEKPGGHGERSVAVGVIEMAAWDLAAKLEDVPLSHLIAKRYRPGTEPAERVWAYAAGGYYYPGRDIAGLLDEVRSYLDLGYRQVKIKIGGAPLDVDLTRIEAVLEVLPAGCKLAVDANGRYSVAEAVVAARALADFELAWYEEPVDPLDLAGHAAVAAVYAGPLATGENLFSTRDAENLFRFGQLRPHLDILQMDPVLSYGLGEYVRTLEVARVHGWEPSAFVPHGGHQFNLHIAAALGLRGCEAYPRVFQPFGGFADGESVDAGFAAVPELPGLGLEGKSRLRPLLDKLLEGLRPQG